MLFEQIRNHTPEAQSYEARQREKRRLARELLNELQEAGYDIPTRNVSLRHPTNLGAFEPQYIFGSVETGSVAVGIYTRKIYE